jgi:hypothetical protein
MRRERERETHITQIGTHVWYRIPQDGTTTRQRDTTKDTQPQRDTIQRETEPHLGHRVRDHRHQPLWRALSKAPYLGFGTVLPQLA